MTAKKPRPITIPAHIAKSQPPLRGTGILSYQDKKDSGYMRQGASANKASYPEKAQFSGCQIVYTLHGPVIGVLLQVDHILQAHGVEGIHKGIPLLVHIGGAGDELLSFNGTNSDILSETV